MEDPAQFEGDCAQVQMSGAYCFRDTAVKCKCSAKGFSSTCYPETAVGCTGNGLGCRDSLNPSWLASAVTAPEDLARLMCRANLGSKDSLELYTNFCLKSIQKLQSERRPKVPYYTVSQRFAACRDEYDYYAAEIFTFVSSYIERISSDSEGGAAGDKKLSAAEQRAKLELEAAIKLFACSAIYPRVQSCTAIHDKYSIGSAEENFQESVNYATCYDPAECWEACNSIVRMHPAIDDAVKFCMVQGLCKNATRATYSAAMRSIADIENQDTCSLEVVCPWRGVNGGLERDNPGQLFPEYAVSPVTMSWIICSSISIFIICLTWSLNFGSRYHVDRNWDLRHNALSMRNKVGKK
eukprot:g3660.t1